MRYDLRRLMTSEPVLTPDELEALGQKILGMTSAETVSVTIDHVAQGTARVSRNKVRSNNDGSEIQLSLTTRFGQKRSAGFSCDRIDDASLRAAVQYLERIAREQPGDPVAIIIPEHPRHYLPGTVWHTSTVDAFGTARHELLPRLIEPVMDAKLVGSAFAGVTARSVLYLTKNGINVSGHETDAEITVVGWTANGTGSGWAGQAERDWANLDAASVTKDAIRLTQMDANPVAVEPGRRTVILGRPAMAQFAHAMAYAWDARSTIVYHATPFADLETGEPKLGRQVFDARVNISADPSDTQGGYLPFSGSEPLVPMSFVEGGVLKNLAFDPNFAIDCGVEPSNDVPFSLRLGPGTPTTIEDMIATCDQGIYVNRVASVEVVDGKTGMMSGVTNGGCFLIEHGKITKPVKNFRFMDSPFLFLNNMVAIGTPKRTAFGYSPWAGGWPIQPSIVPPVMVRDFNFTRLADAI